MTKDINTMKPIDLSDAAFENISNIMAITELLYIADMAGEPIKQGTLGQIAVIIEGWCKELHSISDRQQNLVFQQSVA